MLVIIIGLYLMITYFVGFHMFNLGDPSIGGICIWLLSPVSIPLMFILGFVVG